MTELDGEAVDMLFGLRVFEKMRFCCQDWIEGGKGLETKTRSLLGSILLLPINPSLQDSKQLVQIDRELSLAVPFKLDGIRCLTASLLS